MGLFDWLRGKKKSEQASQPAKSRSEQQDEQADDGVSAVPRLANPAYDAAVEAAATARGAYFDSLGRPDADVMAPLINPMFMGGPAWPTRPAWRRIATDNTTVVMSDGLSDPFEDDALPNTGFAVEVLAETEDDLGDDYQSSFLFHLVYQISQNAASHGGFREVLGKYGLVSMEISTDDGLEAFTSEEGRVGVLLGVAPPTGPASFDAPGGDVLVITAKLLALDELAFAMEKGSEGRQELQRRFEKQGSFHRSSLARPSVV